MNNRGLAALLCLSWLLGCGSRTTSEVVLQSSLEDVHPDGSLFTPATQSLSRGTHWLEQVKSLTIHKASDHLATVAFEPETGDHYLRLKNLPLDSLVPRFHYQPAQSPDGFDALNLMLAEYSRNSVSVPVGSRGESFAHFETNLPETVPWKLAGDYQFVPNSHVKPVRISLVNNCLNPGLWEVSAADRSGEMYHGWFHMPVDFYESLVGQVNRVHVGFVRDALAWKTNEVPLELERLRTVERVIGRSPLGMSDVDAVGYSSQDSRRKLRKGFVEVFRDGTWQPPKRLTELTSGKCRLPEFVPPGKYSFDQRRTFDLRFLRAISHVEVRKVNPKTSYQFNSPKTRSIGDSMEYIELDLVLDDHHILLGNLPLPLLVPQEDFSIHGFGVGILSSNGLAERRKYLLEEGPAPSFAYLCTFKDGAYRGLNSHEFGLEQVFIRTRITPEALWWEITITSYERIVDLVKYEVKIPSELHEQVKRYAQEYISPLYFTYRDDNLR